MKALFVRADRRAESGAVPDPPPRDYFIPVETPEGLTVAGSAGTPKMEHMRFKEFIAVYEVVLPDPEPGVKKEGGG